MKSNSENSYSSDLLAKTANSGEMIILSERKSNNANNAEELIRSIELRGIEHIFFVPGKLIYPLINAIDASKIRGIVCSHETSSGFMADGYSRASRKFGVCLAISGPGTMNLVPAMAAAQADRIPVLYMAGGISTNHEAQGAFQDGSNSGLSELTIVKPLLNSAVEVKNNTILQYELRRSLSNLNYRRKGRAYLSLPIDIQKKKTTVIPPLKPFETFENHESPIDIEALDKILKNYIVNRLNVAILSGCRINNPENALLLRQVAEKYHLPVATTLSGKGSFPETHPLYIGIYGFAGHTRAIETLNSDDIDVLLVFGCDLSQRDSLNWTPKLHGNKTLIVIDEDFDKACMHYQPDIQVFSNLNVSLRYMSNALNRKCVRFENTKNHRTSWLKRIKKLPLTLEHKYKKNKLFMGDVISSIRKLMPSNTNVVVDSGAHRIFMAHYWQSSGCGDYHTSSSLAPMGWAICASVGIKLAAPDRECLVVTGDGCMLMHGIEIQTAARYKVKIIFVVMNNNSHGAMYIDTLQGNGISADYSALPEHDWVKFANSLGVEALKVQSLNEIDSALSRAKNHDGPFLLEILVDNNTPPNSYYAESCIDFEKRLSNI